jgi:hypothetical protein
MKFGFEAKEAKVSFPLQTLITRNPYRRDFARITVCKSAYAHSGQNGGCSADSQRSPFLGITGSAATMGPRSSQSTRMATLFSYVALTLPRWDDRMMIAL